MSNDPNDQWIAHYDQTGGWAHLIRAHSTNGNHWQEHRLDENISDPDGRFLVYTDIDNDEDLLISLRYTEAGPITYHQDFNVAALGSPTLMPEHLMRTIWWTSKTPWRDARPLFWVPIPDEDIFG